MNYLFILFIAVNSQFCQMNSDCGTGYFCDFRLKELGEQCTNCKECADNLICVDSVCATPTEASATSATTEVTVTTTTSVCVAKPSVTVITSLPPSPSPPVPEPSVPVSGRWATLTHYSNYTSDCVEEQPEFAVTINPMFTQDWCGKTMTLVVNGKIFIGTIVDVCDNCMFNDSISLYGDAGKEFLEDAVGNCFFAGNVDWIIT